MATDDTWRRTDDNIRWSMRDGHADPGGRAKMLHAARTGNPAYMGEFKNGFHETQSPSARALFDECCRDDEGRVWNIGQKYK